GGQPAAVRGEDDEGGPEGFAFGPAHLLAGVRIDQADGHAVPGGGSEEAAILRERLGPGGFVVDLVAPQLLARGSVPAHQGAGLPVGRPAVAGGQDLAVGGEREGPGPGGVFQRGETLSAGDVPDADRLQVAPDSETLAVGTEDEIRDAGVLLLELAEFLA